jgi:NhaP-type Na+/H+ or K+/H+ antiporter
MIKAPTRSSIRALIAAVTAGLGGVVLATLAVASPQETSTPVPWGLLIWGVPIGFGAGAGIGIGIWALTRFMWRSNPQNLLLAAVLTLVPAVLGMGAGYLAFGSSHPAAPIAAAIGGSLGLLCGGMEAAASIARRKRLDA